MTQQDRDRKQSRRVLRVLRTAIRKMRKNVSLAHRNHTFIHTTDKAYNELVQVYSRADARFLARNSEVI